MGCTDVHIFKSDNSHSAGRRSDEIEFNMDKTIIGFCAYNPLQPAVPVENLNRRVGAHCRAHHKKSGASRFAVKYQNVT